MKALRWRILALGLAVMLAACGGGSTSDTASESRAAGSDAAGTATATSSTSSAAVGATSSTTTTHAVVVRARATLAAGVGALMAVRVAGTEVGRQYVTAVGNDGSYTYSVAAAVPTGTAIDVVYLNDDVINGVDRNLWVDGVDVDGIVMAPTDATTYDRGDGTAAFDGADLVTPAAGMYWSGALRFVLPASNVR